MKSSWPRPKTISVHTPLIGEAHTHQKLGTVFVLHFDSPYQHARHYVGWTDLVLEDRLKQLAAGHATPLLAAVVKAGIGWRVSRTWEKVTRKKELTLKRTGSASRFCPICVSEGLKAKRVRWKPGESRTPKGKKNGQITSHCDVGSIGRSDDIGYGGGSAVGDSD